MIPDKDGWWLFCEDGMHQVQRIIVIDGEVASDEEWEQAMGRPPSNVMCENYWEGTSVREMTDGTYTTGTWKKDSK